MTKAPKKRPAAPEPLAYVIDEDEIVVLENARAINPQKIGEDLERIRVTHGGGLRPHDVVEAARDPASPLHAHFTWDNVEAAEKYRVSQARTLIRIVRIENQATDSGSVRAFLSIRSDSGARSYRPFTEIAMNGVLRERILEAAERDLVAFKSRYKELQDALEFVDAALEKVRAQRAPKKRGSESRPSA